MSGIALVVKPAGLSSHAVVSRLRRAWGIRKIGHAGTLDPAATGVLVMGVGGATRLLGYLTSADKEYRAVVRLGEATTTDDADGDLVSSTPFIAPEADRIADAFARLTGTVEQVPSAVSAIKVGGKRSYARVRAGESVELAPRRVTIHRLDILDVRPNRGVGGGDVVDVDIDVHCSAGTYIRAIARDAGDLLGVGGHLVSLRRTASGPFLAEECHRLEEIEESPLPAPRWWLTPADAARRSMPYVIVDPQRAASIRHGRPLDDTDTWPGALQQPVALLGDTGLLAVAAREPEGLRYLAVFPDADA